MEPTLTQNGALYLAQHKISKRRTAFFRRLRRAEKSHQQKKGRFSMKRHNGVEIVEPTEVPEAPAHGTGRLGVQALPRRTGLRPGAEAGINSVSFDGRVPCGFVTINPK